MQKILSFTIALLLMTMVKGQTFSFQLYFSDAVGNRDTLILGYDLQATDSIDAAFGEVNIIGLAIDTSLDVRISNEWRNRTMLSLPGTYHTKKQISYYDCTRLSVIPQSIDIHTHHWPVCVSWNSSLFNSSCRNGSVFTSINPGGWWDTGSPSDLGIKILSQSNAACFTSNYADGFMPGFAYVNNASDTVAVFWQAFADSTLTLTVSERPDFEHQLKAFPNPTTDQLSLEVPANFGSVKKLELFSAMGQKAATYKSLLDINISGIAKGLYWVIVVNEKGERLWTQILKE